MLTRDRCHQPFTCCTSHLKLPGFLDAKQKPRCFYIGVSYERTGKKQLRGGILLPAPLFNPVSLFDHLDDAQSGSKRRGNDIPPRSAKAGQKARTSSAVDRLRPNVLRLDTSIRDAARPELMEGSTCFCL